MRNITAASTQQRKHLLTPSTVSPKRALDEQDFIQTQSSTPVTRKETDEDVYRITPPKPPLTFRITANAHHSSPTKISDDKLVSTKISLLKSHRRNLSLDVNVRMSSALSARLDSQEYDIISDSELPSSLDHCSDEYLVVDGLIGQTVGSFTLPTPEENTSQEDPLFHVRLGLFEILQNVLILLPDNLITRIFGTILKVEHLLVLVNQDNVKLREIAVKVCEFS